MQRNLLRLAIVLIAAVLAPVTLISAAGAVPEQEVDERLTFMRQDASGFWQVWVSDADLSGARQLTSGRASSGWPVWSPDGQSIAFDSDRSDPDPDDDQYVYDVFVMRADGTGVVNLTGGVGGSGDPAWSPDGRSIAFQSDQGTGPQGIFVMQRDGTGVRQVTAAPEGAFDGAPRYSPDGDRLIFTRYDDRGGAALFTVQASGEQLRQITPFAIGAGDAHWSPDGKRIVFEAYPSPTSRGDVYVVRDDGSGLRNLTDNAATNGSSDPVWLPDGKRMLFLQGIRNGDEFVLGLATMRASGAQRAFLSSDPVESHQPDWHAGLAGPSGRG